MLSSLRTHEQLRLDIGWEAALLDPKHSVMNDSHPGWLPRLGRDNDLAHDMPIKFGRFLGRNPILGMYRGTNLFFR
jgi:hypothetical protein